MCLAYQGRDQDKIPTTDTDNDDLLKAGLGEKVIKFDDIDIDTNAFRQVILEAYPQLKNAGGYTFFNFTYSRAAFTNCVIVTKVAKGGCRNGMHSYSSCMRYGPISSVSIT